MDTQIQSTSAHAQKELADSVEINNSVRGIAKQRQGQLQTGDEPSARRSRGNHVESDEIFTASETEIELRTPSETGDTDPRFGNTFYQASDAAAVAFEDKGNKLETKSDSEQIAASLVRIAEARGWDEIKVSGSETFRREVWLEAAARRMHVKGYSPSEQDKAELAKRTREGGANTASEQMRRNAWNAQFAAAFTRDVPSDDANTQLELAGAYTATEAIEKQVEADGLSPQQRTVVMARVRQNVINRIKRDDHSKVKVKEVIEETLEVHHDLERSH